MLGDGKAEIAWYGGAHCDEKPRSPSRAILNTQSPAQGKRIAMHKL